MASQTPLESAYIFFSHPIGTFDEFKTAVTRANDRTLPLEEQIHRITELTKWIKQSGNSPKLLPSLIDTNRSASITSCLLRKVRQKRIDEEELLFTKYFPEDTVLPFCLAMREAVSVKDWATFDRIINQPRFLEMASVEVGADPIKPPFHGKNYNNAWRQYNKALARHKEGKEKREAALKIFSAAAQICLENNRFVSLDILREKARSVATDFFRKLQKGDPWSINNTARRSPFSMPDIFAKFPTRKASLHFKGL